MAKKEVTVESVIQSLRSYLYDKLTINEELLVKCEGNLLPKGTVSELRALLDKGKQSEAVYKCLHYIDSYYTMEALGKFVDLLQGLSKKYPNYADIVSRFNDAMGRSTSERETASTRHREQQEANNEGTSERETASTRHREQQEADNEVDGPPPRESYSHVNAKDVLKTFKWRDLSKDIKDMLNKPRLEIMERDHNLIDSGCNSSIKAYLDQGKLDEAATAFRNYFEKNHKGDALLRFCEFLREEAEEAGDAARLIDLADKIERAVKAKGPPGTS